jgi:hypothetical protein
MNMDDRIHATRGWIAGATAETQPDPDDLDRRRRGRRRTRALTYATAIAVLVLGVLTYALARDDGTEMVEAGPASTAQPPPGAGGALEPSDGPAFVLDEPPDDWAIVTPPTVSLDHSAAFEGEIYSEVHVRFEDEQDAFSAHAGELAATIRIAVGTYDRNALDALFRDPIERVTISGLDFDLVETGDDEFAQTALVPVDTTDQTYLITAQGVDAATLIEMAEPIDPTKTIPRVGPAPDGFVVLHAGVPDFAALSEGTSVTYQHQAGDPSVTITTFDGVRISCFAHAWPYSDTEITRIGGDAGVIAQLDGEPDATGTYRALWNHDADTLIHIAAVGITRATLIDLADTLTERDNVDNAYRTHLQIAS